VNTVAEKDGRLRRAIFRIAPFASFAGLSALTAVDGIDSLAVLFGIGALASGKRLLDRRGNQRGGLTPPVPPRGNSTILVLDGSACREMPSAKTTRVKYLSG
jgi:hypothetical protein